jgi:hypothetical protein
MYRQVWPPHACNEDSPLVRNRIAECYIGFVDVRTKPLRWHAVSVRLRHDNVVALHLFASHSS